MTFDPTRESTFEPQTSTAFSSLPQQSQYIPRLAPRDLGEQDSVLSSYLPQDQPSVPKGDYSQVGKFNLGLNLPAPWVSPIRPEALDPRTPAPVLGPQAPGIFEGIFRGVEQLPGQFLPGYINDHVNNLFGLVGSVPDTVLRQFGTIKELPGGGDVEQAFSIMPETAEKQRYEQAILASPTNRLHFMAQYLREFEKDWASETGRNRLLSGFDLPSESLAEQLSRVVGGLLGTSNLTSRRTYVGSPARDVRGTVLDAPVGSLPEDLEYLRTRYLASDQTEQDYNDLLDDIAGSRWAWSNDPGLVGSAASLFSDVLTDPLTYLSFGIGKAAAVVGRGTVGIRAMKAVSLGDRLAPEVMAGIRSTLPKGADNLAIMDRLRQVRPDIVDQATDALTRSQKASLQLEPMIRKAADISNRAMDPLSWFGVDRVGKGLTAVLANKALDGQVNAMGAGRLLSYTRAAIRNRGTDDRLAAALGTANAYTANSVMAESLAREVTESIGPELGDATPMEVIAARREVRDIIDEVEDHYRRVEYQPGIAPGRSGAAAVAERLEQDKEFARKVYQDLTGAGDDEAAAWVEKHISTRSGEKHISNMHMLHFSDSINTMDAARQESIRQLEVALRGVAEGSEEATAIAERIDRRQRYTLIGARELTDDRARQLLVLANEGKAADIRAAIAQYQQLSANFRGKRLADDVLLARARRVLEDMLENDTLVKTVPDASLDGPLMTWRQREHARYGDEYSYQVGIAPENPWRPTFDEDGVAIAVNPWVPAVPATGRAKMPTTMDRVRLGLFTPIRGNRILFEAKTRFVRGAVEKGLNPGEAESLYHAIRKAADEQRVGTRGLRPDQLWQISGSIDLPPFVRAKLPDRELAMLVARSFEGELSTVGVTSKLSGILKTRMSNRMLNAGYIAEAMYPMIRYYGSPIFNAQEFAEGPLLNIFRGHKPGLGRWSEKDKAILRVLDKLNSHERYADQTEHIFLVAAAARVVREKMGEGTRVEQAVGRIDAAKGAFAGRGLASIKEQNYIRQAGHEAAEAFREAIEQVAPGEYARMQVAYDTVDPLDIMLRYFNEKGITREENPRWNVFMMDISKPADMGMEANLLLGDHARAMGFESTADLRQAIRTGDFPRSRFDDAYDSLGIDPAYKERLWTVLNNPSRPELRNTWIDDLVTSGVSRGTAERQVKEAMQTFQAATKAMGLKLDDWLPNRFSDWKQAQAWLDRLGEAQTALVGGRVAEHTLPSPDLIARAGASPPIGAGGSNQVHDIPGTPYMLRRAKWGSPVTGAWERVDDGLPEGLNAGQAVWRERYSGTDREPAEIVLRQPGEPVAFTSNEVPDDIRQSGGMVAYGDERFARRLDAQAAAPQSAYDDLARQTRALMDAGFAVDPSKSNNLLYDAATGRFGWVDVRKSGESAGYTTVSYPVIAMMGNSWANYTALDKAALQPTFRAIFDKAWKAAEDAGLPPPSPNDSSLAFSASLAGYADVPPYNPRPARPWAAPGGPVGGDHGPALRLFAEDIQLSGRKRIAEARGVEGWDDSTVDWLRERFDAFAADPEAVADNPTMHHLFTSYARFVRDALDAPEGPVGRIEQVLNRASVDDLYRELGVDPDGPRPAVRAAADGTPELIETASLFGSGKKLDEVELAPGGAGYIVSKKPPEYLYRAISEEEWTKAKAQGYLQSDGRMNLSADEGTVVSLEPSTFYLPGRLASSAPGDHPGRIIRIKYDPAEKWRLDADGYVKTSERIPIERVDKDVSLVTRRRSGADYDTVRVTDRPPLPPFKDVAKRNADVPSAMFDADEHRVWEAARHALLRYEDQAQKTHFYARGRNWVERSLNHPYLGLYPLSYMWGKMVPEMVRFLVKKPFGISAPLGGLLLAKDVWMNVQLQLQTDEDTRKWVDEHPEMLRFMFIMTPGTPFELPVNVPVFWRRATENLLTNASKGPEEQKVAFDSMKALSDTVQYAFGLGHFFDTVNSITQEGRDAVLGQPQPEEGGVTGTGGYTFSSLGQQGNTP